VLALSIAAFVLEGDGNVTAPLAEFVEELAVSIALGVVFGLVLAVAIARRRVGIWRESPVVALAALIAVAYAAIDSAGGSGYVGAFVAGAIAGNAESLGLGRAEHHERELSLFAERITDIVVLFVFILVGATLPFDAMTDNAAPALATLASLLFVARPLTVAASLLPDRRGRWTREELAFVTWTRETGVVPVALVGILVAEGVPYEDEILTLVAFAIVVTLGLQATTKEWLARRLGLAETPAEATLFAAR
jgi:potassium/hydrogen antiporter